MQSLPGCGENEQAPWNLRQDAGAVRRLVAANRATVRQARRCFERERDDFVRALAALPCDEPDATGITWSERRASAVVGDAAAPLVHGIHVRSCLPEEVWTRPSRLKHHSGFRGWCNHPGTARFRQNLQPWRVGRMAIAPVLKTGVRKDIRVRIPGPPFR